MSSPRRLEVERALVKGMTYERIGEMFGEPGGINARGVLAHVKRGHVPINAPAVRAVARARSKEVSEAIAPLIQGAAANLSFAHAVVDRVRVRLESAEIQPNVLDGLAAARLIIECEAGSGPVDTNEWQTEFMAVFETVQDIMTPAQFEDMGARLHARSREREAAQRRRRPPPTRLRRAFRKTGSTRSPPGARCPSVALAGLPEVPAPPGRLSVSTESPGA